MFFSGSFALLSIFADGDTLDGLSMLFGLSETIWPLARVELAVDASDVLRTSDGCTELKNTS